MFGIQTAIQGGSVPLLANSSKKRMKRIYEKQRAMPMPMWSPVPPRTLREGERNTDECQNERTDRIGVTGVLFDLNDVDRVGTLASLLFEELVQFHYIHCFYQLVSASQFIDIQINECVQIAVLRESFHTERIERAGGISSGRPPLGFGIEPHLCGFERCGHRSRFVLFQAEERSLVRFL